MRRRLRTYASLVLLALAVLVVVGWLALPFLVERRLLEELSAAGIAVASLNVAAVGLYETRIEDVRIGSSGDVTAGEIVASYDFRHFLQASPQRLVVRDLRASARLASGGLSFGSLGLTNEDGGGGVFGAALLRAVPPVVIESGRIELVTPVGPVTAPFQGIMNPRPDGSLAAAIDVQAQSEHATLRGEIKLVAAAGAIDADLTIGDGTITIAQTLSTTFTGEARLIWVSTENPHISADLKLLGTSLAEVAFPAGGLTIDVTDAQWTAQVALAGVDRSSDVQAKVIVTDPYDKPRLNATGSVTAAVGAWLWPVLALPQPQRGTAQVDLRLEGLLPDGRLLDQSITTPGEVIGLLAHSNVSGGAYGTIDNLVLPDIATIESARVRADIHAADGTVSIEQNSELSATATVAPALTRNLDLPAELAALLAGRLTASLALPQPLHLVASNGKTTAIGDLRVNLASASGPTLDLQLEGEALLSADLVVSEFATGNSRAILSGITVPAIGLGRLEFEGSIAGKPNEFDGRLHAMGDFSDLSIGSLTAVGSNVDLDAAIAMADERISIHLVNDGAAVLRQLSGAALASKVKEVAIPLVPSGQPLIAIDLNDRAVLRAAYDLRLGAIKATAPLLLGGRKPLPIILSLSGMRWTGTWSSEDGHQSSVELTDESLAFPSLDVVAKGVRAGIAIKPDKWSADLGVASITHSAKPPLITPLSLAGTAEMIGDRLSFAGVLSDKAKRLSSTIEAEHSFAASKGSAKLKMTPLAFEPGGLQPRDVAPAIGSQIQEVTGKAAIGGTVTWNAGKVVSNLELLLQDLSFKSSQADIVRLNSVVKINSLVPFTTRPGQQLAAGMVDVGLPLTDLVAAFRIDPGPQLVIENARLALTGGEVSMAEVAIDLSDPHAELALNVRDVDLARLLQLAQIKGLAGTGNLAGQIPVSVTSDTVTIRNATLAATGPGTLSYAPGATPSALLGGGESVDMAMKALNNFQYSDLSLTMSREPGGDTVALMHVKGRNPDFYGGYPVEFNLNISGKLDQILDRSLAGYRIPESIRKSLGDFGQ
jgi:Dicarboxylate transport